MSSSFTINSPFGSKKTYSFRSIKQIFEDDLELYRKANESSEENRQRELEENQKKLTERIERDILGIGKTDEEKREEKLRNERLIRERLEKKEREKKESERRQQEEEREEQKRVEELRKQTEEIKQQQQQQPEEKEDIGEFFYNEGFGGNFDDPEYLGNYGFYKTEENVGEGEEDVYNEYGEYGEYETHERAEQEDESSSGEEELYDYERYIHERIDLQTPKLGSMKNRPVEIVTSIPKKNVITGHTWSTVFNEYQKIQSLYNFKEFSSFNGEENTFLVDPELDFLYVSSDAPPSVTIKGVPFLINTPETSFLNYRDIYKIDLRNYKSLSDSLKIGIVPLNNENPIELELLFDVKCVNCNRKRNEGGCVKTVKDVKFFRWAPLDEVYDKYLTSFSVCICYPRPYFQGGVSSSPKIPPEFIKNFRSLMSTFVLGKDIFQDAKKSFNLLIGIYNKSRKLHPTEMVNREDVLLYFEENGFSSFLRTFTPKFMDQPKLWARNSSELINSVDKEIEKILIDTDDSVYSYFYDLKRSEISPEREAMMRSELHEMIIKSISSESHRIGTVRDFFSVVQEKIKRTRWANLQSSLYKIVDNASQNPVIRVSFDIERMNHVYKTTSKNLIENNEKIKSIYGDVIFNGKRAARRMEWKPNLVGINILVVDDVYYYSEYIFKIRSFVVNDTKISNTRTRTFEEKVNALEMFKDEITKSFLENI